MAKGRIIVNAITKDKRINDLSSDTSRLAFTWLVTFADREGRTHGDPALVRSMLFPRRTDVTAEQVEAYITEWAGAGLVVWYEAEGDRWIFFPAFSKHQAGFDQRHEPASYIPDPPEVTESVRTAPVQCTSEVKGNESNRSEQKIVAASAASPPAKSNPKKREPKPEAPPAVKYYHDLTTKWPASVWYEKVDQAVGRDPPNLQRWSDTITAWLGLGWNKTNVKGMLEFFERNEIPGTNGRLIHDQRRNKNHGLAGLRGGNSEYRVLSKEEWEAAKQAQRDGIDLGDGPALPDLRLPQERVAEK